VGRLARKRPILVLKDWGLIVVEEIFESFLRFRRDIAFVGLKLGKLALL